MGIKPFCYGLSAFAFTLSGWLWSTVAHANVMDGGHTARSGFLLPASQMIGVLTGAIAGHFLLGRLKHRLLVIAHNQTALQTSQTEVHAPLALLLNLFLGTARAGLWLIVALFTAHLFPATRRWSQQAFNSLLSTFTAPELTLGNRAFSLIDLLVLVVLFFSVIIFAGILTNALRCRVLRSAGINRGLQEVIATLTKYGVITIASIVLLQLWGLDLSSLTILASALGVGIGFGLQDIAKNFGSGLVLVFERPIQVGDFVEVGEFKGTVERIGARSTEIRTLDHVSIIVPNSRFLEKEVINWSHHNPASRLHIPVGVAYQADPQTVQEALLEAAQNHPDVLSSPAPRILFKGFGDSALHFELLIWTAEPNRQFLLQSDLNFRIHEVFRRRQIQIPFPQRDLHLRSIQLTPEDQSVVKSYWSQAQNGH